MGTSEVKEMQKQLAADEKFRLRHDRNQVDLNSGKTDEVLLSDGSVTTIEEERERQRKLEAEQSEEVKKQFESSAALFVGRPALIPAVGAGNAAGAKPVPARRAKPKAAPVKTEAKKSASKPKTKKRAAPKQKAPALPGVPPPPPVDAAAQTSKTGENNQPAS